MKFHAACPINSSHVSCGHLKDIEFEGLFDEDKVVVGHTKTVVIGGAEKRTTGN